ncbi:hypothetical protein AGMMS4952_27320 [Spirochaetia bacterium]|nr:hypothetical protein AGMMS4952_27320 [Spirochaetia bacterium]
MSGKYQKRFNKIPGWIGSKDLRNRARTAAAPNAFSRNRKMPLQDILLCTLAKKGKTGSMEVRKFFEDKGGGAGVSKQGYFQQRKKVNYEVFAALTADYLQDFYQGDEPLRWHGYLVLAVDGSKVEVPNSPENQKTFGAVTNQHGQTLARALLSSVMDVYNDFFLDIQIDTISASEKELARKHIAPVKAIIGDAPCILIADRNYPSLGMAHILEEQGIRYLFRLKTGDYQKERDAMEGRDEEVLLRHTPARLKSMKKSTPELAGTLTTTGSTQTRIINLKLDSGQEVTLMTNIPTDISTEEVQQLYLKRWQIEKKYHTLKNKMQFESITGKASVYVYQDFWAQVIVYNMIQDVMHSANEEAELRGMEKAYTYPIRVNENIAIGLFKDRFVKIFVEPDEENRLELLSQLQSDIERYVLPVRVSPTSPRTRHPSNKHPQNLKPSF